MTEWQKKSLIVYLLYYAVYLI